MSNTITITPVNKTDHEILEIWANMFSTPAKRKHINALVPNKTNNISELFGFIKKSGKYSFVWVIRENTMGTAVGCVIFDKDFYEEKNSIGFFVGKEYTRMGYASQAVQLLLPELIKMRIPTICACTYGLNKASRGLLEGLGFSMRVLGVQKWSNGNIVFKYTKRLI